MCFTTVYTITIFIARIVAAISSQKPCPQNTLTDCLLDPCILATCPAFPQAECRDFRCGQCKPEFWNMGQEVTSQCETGVTGNEDLLSTLLSLTAVDQPLSDPSLKSSSLSSSDNSSTQSSDCPGGQQLHKCSYRPCAVMSCPAFPSSTCRDNYCGGCNAEFWMIQQEVTSQCNKPKLNEANEMNKYSSASCPTGNQFQCSTSLCDTSLCDTYPKATCWVDNCGGCFIRHFLDGQDVTSKCQLTSNAIGEAMPLYFMFPDLMSF